MEGGLGVVKEGNLRWVRVEAGRMVNVGWMVESKGEEMEVCGVASEVRGEMGREVVQAEGVGRWVEELVRVALQVV